MSGSSYNGYSWRQRNKILLAYHRGEAGPDFTLAGKPCGLCGDPDRAPGEWHSEDYSEPFSFQPPESYPMCRSCHSRIHKRFNAPDEEWELFCLHLEAGGFGNEFVPLYPKATRRSVIEQMRNGFIPKVDPIRPLDDRLRWWRSLTLNPESLEAPWARPRPLKARPSIVDYENAMVAIALSAKERRILSLHANSAFRSVTMSKIAVEVLNSKSASAANLIYGKLAHKIADELNWEVDRREDQTPIWMSVIAEGWQPSRRPEYEWVMIPSLQSAVLSAEFSE